MLSVPDCSAETDEPCRESCGCLQRRASHPQPCLPVQMRKASKVRECSWISDLFGDHSMDTYDGRDPPQPNHLLRFLYKANVNLAAMSHPQLKRPLHPRQRRSQCPPRPSASPALAIYPFLDPRHPAHQASTSPSIRGLPAPRV